MAGDLTLIAEGENAALTVQCGNSGGGPEGIQAQSLTVNGGTVTAIGGSADGTPSAGIYVNTALTVNSGVVYAHGGSSGVWSFGVHTGMENMGSGTITVAPGAALYATGGEGSLASAGVWAATVSHNVNALGIAMSETEDAATIDYTVYGDLVLDKNVTISNPYEGTEDEDKTTITFTVPAGTSLTVSSGVTLDLSALDAEKIEFLGTVINNGTILLPEGFDIEKAPQSGEISIGDKSYTWNDADGEWVCGEEMPPLVIADNSITLTVDEDGVTYYQQGSGSKYAYTGQITITGTSSANSITVQSGEHNVVLSDLSISAAAPFDISEGAMVNLYLNGTNNLTATAEGKAGLHVPSGAELTIDELDGSTGSLTAIGGMYSAGIGSQNVNKWEDLNTGKITINGGTIIAEGADGGAGIGGANYCSVTDIHINGGIISASSDQGRLTSGGAGIGGGSEGKTATITITGGYITAIGDESAAGIGTSGMNGTATITISGGTIIANGGGSAQADIGYGRTDGSTATTIITGGSIKANTIANPVAAQDGASVSLQTVDIPDGYDISDLNIKDGDNQSYTYGLDDVQPIEGKVYLYLPDGVTASVPTITKYSLWVGGEQFTSKNLTITDDNGGTAAYNPDTHTLSLNNYNYTGPGYNSGVGTDVYLNGIYCAEYKYDADDNLIPLNLVITGQNNITVESEVGTIVSGCYGIQYSASIHISGNSNINDILILTAADATVSSTGIFANDLTVENCKLTVTAGEAATSTGVSTSASITISGSGSLTAKGGNAATASYGLSATQNVTVSGNGSLTAKGGETTGTSYGAYAVGSITVSDSGSLTVIGGKATSFSCGVSATNSITISGSANLTASGGDAADSYGVLANFSISGGEIVVQGNSVAFSYKPSIDEAYTNAVVWYGENETAANAAGVKQITDLENNYYSQKYVKIAPAPACDHSESAHTSVTKTNDEKHSFTCTVCSITVSEDHTPDSRGQTCQGYWCTECESWYGEKDPDNHVALDAEGKCACGTAVYPIWVGGIQVTSRNQENVLAWVNGTPPVRYDPDTNTLHLNNAKISDETDGTIDLSVEGDINLDLLGSSWVDDRIQVTGDLTISGSGSLEVKTGVVRVSAKNVTIHSGTLMIDGGNYGILAEETVTIHGGTVTTESLIQADDIVIGGGTVTVNDGHITGFNCVTIDNAVVTVTENTMSTGIYSKKTITFGTRAHVKSTGHNCAISYDEINMMGNGYSRTSVDGVFAAFENPGYVKYFEYIGKELVQEEISEDGKNHSLECTCGCGTVLKTGEISYIVADNKIIWSCSVCGELGSAALIAENAAFSGTSYTDATVEYSGTLSQTLTIAYKQGETTLETAPINAGSYTAEISYGGCTISKDFAITPKVLTAEDVTITLSPDSFLYDGSEKLPAVTIKLGDETLDGGTYAAGYDDTNTTCDYQVLIPYDQVTPGQKAITIFFRNNYSGEAVVHYTITIPEAILSPATPNGENGWYKDASLLAPSHYAISTIKDGTFGSSLDLSDGIYESIKYWLTSTDNVNCEPISLTWMGSIKVDGTAPAVSGTADSVADSTASITVTAEDNLSDVASVTLTCADASVTIGALTDGAFPVSGMQPNTAYTFTLTAKDEAGNESNTTVNLTTERGNSSVIEAPTANKLTYTGEAQPLVTAGEANGGTMYYSLGNDGTFSTNIPTATNAGDYTVWYYVQGDENHSNTDAESVAVTIAKAYCIDVAPVANENLVYNGQPQELITAGTTIDGHAIRYCFPGESYQANIPTATDAGTYTVDWYAGYDAPNYNMSRGQITVTIGQLDITDQNVDITLTDELTYNGEEQTMGVSAVKLDDLDVTFTVTGNAGTDVADYTLTVTGNGNFTGTATKQWSIAKKNISGASITLGDSLTYNGEQQTQTVASVKVDGMTVTYAVSGNTGTDAKGYTLTVTGSGNFEGTATTDWRIAEKNIDGATITLGDSLTYNGERQTQEVSEVKADGLTVTYDVTDNQQTNAGNYILTVTGNGNFAGTATADWSIAQAKLTITANDSSITYGDVPTANGVTGTGFVSSENIEALSGELAYSYSYEQFGNIGTYKITPSGLTSGNYEITFVDGALTVTAKEITVTAEDKSKTYGDADPALTCKVEGLVNGDKLTGELKRAAGEDVGSYAIEQNTLTAGNNYNISYTGAKLTVDKRNVTVSAKDQTITYGETISATEITATGLVDGHSVTVTLTPSTANVTANGTITASAAVITADGTDVTDNYNVSYTSGKLVIEPDTAKIDALTTDNVTSANEEDIKAVQAMMASAETDGVDEATAAEWAAITAKCEDLIEKIEAVKTENARIADAVSKFDLATVKSSDETAISQLISDIDNQLATNNLTDAEKSELEGLKTKCNNLIAKIDGTETLIGQLEKTVDDLDAETVKSTDKATLEQVIADAETLIDSGNVTEAEKEALKLTQEDAEALIKVIDDTAAENKELTEQAATFDEDAVKSTDKENLEQLAQDIEDLLDTDNLTEDERAALETVLEQVEGMIDTIEDTAEDSKAATDVIDALDPATVTSDDKDELEQAIETIDELLKDDHLTEDERKALEDAKADAEALIDVIEAAQDATDTENTEKVEDVTADNVKPEDKEALEDAKADLEKALEENAGNYTEEEKKAIRDEIQRIDDAMVALENVEDVTDAITQLPKTVEPDDEESAEKILDAKEAYDELTDHEKSLVDESTKEKLDDLVAALTAYDIIKGDGGKWTKGSSSGLSFTANGSFSKFVGIEVDGKEVDEKYYDAKAGSTIITLKQSFLKRLSTGEHTITVLYTDGETSGTFKILAASSTPATGDDSNIMLYGSMFTMSLAALVVLLLASKKRKQAS